MACPAGRAVAGKSAAAAVADRSAVKFTRRWMAGTWRANIRATYAQGLRTLPACLRTGAAIATLAATIAYDTAVVVARAAAASCDADDR